MKILLTIDHPAWVHQFHHIVHTLESRGDQVKVVAIDRGGVGELLESYGIAYVRCATTTGKGVLQKALLLVWLSLEHTWQGLRFRPDVFIGRASPMQAFAAWVCRKPHLLYEDTEVSKFSLNLCKRLSTKILTPRTFLTDLGEKQERVDTYKELFYLHPSVFTPDKQVLREAGFEPDEPYIILRFSAWNASHDIGRRGLDVAGKEALVKRFKKYGRVYVSDEGTLPESLASYRLSTPYALIHHVLAFARLVYSEGATMASESVVLGTHAIYVNTLLSGTTQEMHRRFELLYPFQQGEDRYQKAADKAEELLADPALEQKGREKRARLLKEKIDINDYFICETDRLAKVGRKGKA
ncbi:MAG: hypothetical protein GXY67_03520 [Clostridiales bacterium]|nr:hypothetical protein [Clostridiales bacterium]